MYYNDGSKNPPRLRMEINWWNMDSLVEGSSFPGDHTDPGARIDAVLLAGYDGINTGDPALCHPRGLRTTTGFRADTVDELKKQADEAGALGHDAIGVHLGTGMENVREACRLYEGVCQTSESVELPIFVETHRATLTQDMFRAVEMARLFPEVKYLGDFSHWWTGLEWCYGDVDQKIDFVTPVLSNVGMLQGRIGTPGSIQVKLEHVNEKSFSFFRTMWTKAMTHFIQRREPGSVFIFAVELLGASISYARTFPSGSGGMTEESDRWQEASLVRDLASECWSAALSKASS